MTNRNQAINTDEKTSTNSKTKKERNNMAATNHKYKARKRFLVNTKCDPIRSLLDKIRSQKISFSIIQIPLCSTRIHTHAPKRASVSSHCMRDA